MNIKRVLKVGLLATMIGVIVRYRRVIADGWFTAKDNGRPYPQSETSITDIHRGRYRPRRHAHHDKRGGMQLPADVVDRLRRDNADLSLPAEARADLERGDVERAIERLVATGQDHLVYAMAHGHIAPGPDDFGAMQAAAWRYVERKRSEV